MPVDMNPNGTIFGGWIMAQMDMAAGIASEQRAGGMTLTVAVSELTLKHPLYPGQVVEIFTDLVRTGRTSMTYGIELWAYAAKGADRVKAAMATFVMVAIDDQGRPRPVVL